ncbi:hypothetical protein BZG36_03422 [Bifiguratus adelaidae]|uniref:Homoserine dehydrogenase n=1 Tax=Bifiguratus adelaidae TaxID=1938954 RepID=A0A261XYT1_9FUNG|nr:hypothetical protein BZG36_03422 [Bifiguratus adelaidae]
MVNVGIVGVGLVGSELIAQLVAHGASRNLRIVALSSSKKMHLSNEQYTGITSDWRQAVDSGEPSDLGRLASYLAAGKDHGVVIDCTSSDSVAELYPSWLKQGLSIVTPNKKGFSGDLNLYKSIVELSRSANGPFAYHESTVGAGLPVLATLTDLVKTGDKVTKIEGIFSGTLSYIFNNFSSLSSSEPKNFSEIVSVAKELGYTEPDPRDDLNGMDVARKVTICARAIGLPATLETLAVENIVPSALQTVASASEFLDRLPEFDAHFAELNGEALKEKQVLRYVGVVDPQGGSGVKLVKYPASHPFASLQGSDNIIKFTTERFPNGLIIQGAGAGAAVTAFGIFSDLIKVQERVHV